MILKPNFDHGIKSAGLFGSRATGRFRTSSDIDLVLYGSLSQADVARLTTEFQESSIGLSIDVVAYDDACEELRAHIDRAGKEIWSRSSPEGSMTSSDLAH